MAGETGGSASKRLIVAGPSALKITRLRGGLIRDCIARGIAVRAIAPEMRVEDAQALITMGAEVASVAMRPEKFSFFPARRTMSDLSDQIRAWQPAAVLAFGSDIAPLVVRAAKRARVPRSALLVSELPGRKVSKALTRAAAVADFVIAHNVEDQRLLEIAKGVDGDKVVVVPGAGADLAGFEALPLPPLTGPLVFLASARLDRVKGVLDFLEAARAVAATTDAARFVLTGPAGSGEGAIAAEVISRYSDCVNYLGDARDMREALRQAHVFVSPSHLEGMPPAVLQAMAAGRPVIATDIPGLRETVDEMINGTLVAAGSAEDLAAAVKRVIAHRDLLPAMGRASRAKAERLFSMSAVNAKILEALRLL